MLNFLYNLPDTGLFAILSSFSILISIFCVLLITRYVPLRARYKDNPVLGNISALISIIYGVLAGLTALYLINNISYTADAIQREANGVANIYRDSKWLSSPTREHIQLNVKRYLDVVIRVEWPLMGKGEKPNHDADGIIDAISEELSHYNATNNNETIILTQLVGEVKTLYDAREQRIHMSKIELNSEIWIVIIIGTILTLAIIYLFGMNLYLHLFSVTAVALMASSLIYLLITLDRPFQGEFIVNPEAFQWVLDVVTKETHVAH